VDADARRRVGEAAWTAVRAHQGACERTLEALEGLLERAGITRADGGPA
jgi:hypothetical protein